MDHQEKAFRFAARIIGEIGYIPKTEKVPFTGWLSQETAKALEEVAEPLERALRIARRAFGDGYLTFVQARGKGNGIDEYREVVRIIDAALAGKGE
jgi:hypothetical protein